MKALPARIRVAVEAALGEAAGQRGGIGIARVAPVGGGCISETARLETSRGESFFLKWNDGGVPAGLFAAEAAGLEALRATGAVRVPAVVGEGADWLLLEWLERGRARESTWAELGRSLAALHRVREPRFGSTDDNFIGSLPQRNRQHDSWADFWREERLLPQIRRAAGQFQPQDRRRLDRFAETALTPLLAPIEDEGASRLHGDLWSGNVHICSDGVAAVIDPSCYHGHREVDLAMAALFGGFDHAFFHAYDEAWPLRAGHEQRRAAYQLYYLLVHVNLFGAGYLGQTLSVLGRAGG